METESNRYRTTSGILDGNLVTSEWTTVDGKNAGKTNATTPQQQALAEVLAQYEKKLARKYNDTLETAARSNIFQPMLAATYKPDKTVDGFYYHQPKLDGIRCLMKPEGGFSREGKPFFTVQHIFEALEVPLAEGLIFDGELYNHELKDDFDKLVSLVKQQKPEKLTETDLSEIREKVQYHIYDVFDPANPDRPFEQRMELLQEIFQQFDVDTNNLCLVPTGSINSLLELEDAHGLYIEQGYEGIMLRVKRSPYEHKRSKYLIKHKNFQTEEFLVIDIESGIGNWVGIAKKVVLQLPDGRQFKSGIDGSMDKNRLRLAEKAKYIGGDALCRFQNYTPDGIPRFGVIKFLYGGKRDI